MLRVARLRVTLHRGEGSAPHQIHFSGPITFLSVPRLEETRVWLAAQGAEAGVSAEEDVNDAARAVAVRQLENLRKFSLVRERIEAGALELNAWFYDVGKAELFEWDEEKKAFEVLGARPL